MTTREAVLNGEVAIIAPDGFLDFAVSENIFAGNAMNRRLYYQYGVALNRNPFGHVDQSIGKNVAAGNVGLIPPTLTIEDDLEEHVVDGLRLVFQNTPNTEAPAEMHTFFPEFDALWVAEKASDLKEAAAMAEELIDSGKALAKLEEYVAATQSAAAKRQKTA